MAWLSLALETIAGLLIAATVAGASPYLDLVNQYRTGDQDDAVKALAVLREGRSADRVLDELESLPVSATSVPDPAKAPQAAAALHLETAFYMMRRGETSAAAQHLHIARQIVDSSRFQHLAKIRPELRDEHARFRRDVYLGVLWMLQAEHGDDPLVKHLDRIRGEYPNDGDVALALGTFEEYQSSSAIIRVMRPPTAVMAAGPWRRNTQQILLQSAEKHLRNALKFDPSLVEAHLRLGRVLQQRGLLPDARAELEAALGPDTPLPIRYLASMFLIDVLDASGQSAASLARARDLVARFPECQSAQLALSRAYEARGQRAAGLTALAPLWKEESQRRCVDPWWGYYLGQVWRTGALLERLRGQVRAAR